MSNPVLTRLASALASSYELHREIGAGGMATVFLARDIRHEREVAIKVLHPDLGAALGGERFLTEIRTTARLQHPHILPLLDSGSADGLLFYVMPLVAGESLRARLDREGVLPIADAVRIAREVASALDYAHRQQVIHRDIKPENILLHDGSALVADFGIALAVQSAGGARMTQTGLSLGTPQYMSPEQAMGERKIDSRSDLYALGAVTYEMVTGEPPFTGNTVQAIVARVLTERPTAPSALRDTVPPHVEQAVMRALSKLPADRQASAREFADALAGASLASTTTASGERRVAAVTSTNRGMLAGMGLLTLLALATATWSFNREPAVAAAGQYRYEIEASTGIGDRVTQGDFALSPDGRSVAYVTTDTSGTPSLWLRRLDSLRAVRVRGADNASRPVWSPDSRFLAFFSGNRLMRVDVRGGLPKEIAPLDGFGRAAVWMADDHIVFNTQPTPVLQRVPANGGRPEPFMPLDTAAGEVLQQGMALLPDSRHFTFVSLTPRDSAAPVKVWLADGSTVPARRLRVITTLRAIRDLGGFAATNDGYVLLREGELWTAGMDPKTFAMRGEPEALVTGQMIRGFSLSRSGVLVYLQHTTAGTRRLLLLDRDGKETGQIGDRVDGAGYDYMGPRFSPDGRWLAYEYHSGRGTGDMFLYDTRSGRSTRHTNDESAHNGFPAWAPDSRQLVYQSTRDGGNLYIRNVGEQATHHLVLPRKTGFPSDWSPDGRIILFGSEYAGRDIWRTSPEGDSVMPVLNTRADELHAAFSPDGRWLAYATDESGRYEVVVRRWPLTPEQWPVSAGVGEGPRWRADGKELFYLAHELGQPTAGVMAVDVSQSGNSITFGTPRPLFRLPIAMGTGFMRSATHYDVRSDGQLFAAVVLDEVTASSAPKLQVFVGWQEGRAREEK